MDIQELIWKRCREAGMTDAGAAGVLGNVQAESGFVPNNVENRCRMSDAEYTALVDAGKYKDFETDEGKYYGYGLFQHTFPSRKHELLQMARERGVSISDPDVQIDLMLRELPRDYPATWALLRSTQSADDAAKCFMLNFEKPADQSDDAIKYRQGLARALLAEMKNQSTDKPEPETQPATYIYVDIKLRELCYGLKGDDVRVMQQLLWLQGTTALTIDGIFGAETKNALAKFQLVNHLTADGICGKNTWSALLGGKTA